ncbi:MAG TPA: fibronectin type III domain-containing protein [Verrucomicrobiae bacterium]|nr:fibronectin type III domain-containing protein [Verrucomicrobiae bacterium]
MGRRLQCTIGTVVILGFILNGCNSKRPTGPERNVPSAVTNLSADSPTDTSLRLTWTAPGDDGMTGTASRYDIRFSKSVSATWEVMAQVIGEPTPKAAGQTESFTVGGLSPTTTYYFLLKTADEVPNWSGLSNKAVGMTSANPTIAFNPTSVTFTDTIGTSSPAAKTVDVTNGGGGSLTGLAVGSITYGAGASGWLSAGLSGTSAPTTLTLTASLSGLSAGGYTATVPVTSGVASNSPQTVSVTFQVVDQSPTIAFNPTSVTFTDTIGTANPAAKIVNVTNGGGGSLTGLTVGTISYGAGASEWLTAVLSGTTAPTTLTLMSNLSGLSAGSYTATVPVTSGVASNSPQMISVSFKVETAPTIQGRVVGLKPSGFVDPTGLRFFVRAGATVDSVDVQGGQFSLSTELLRFDSVELYLDAKDPSLREFHPSYIKTSSAEVMNLVGQMRLNFVLVPYQWLVTNGIHAGSNVATTMSEAFQKDPINPEPINVEPFYLREQSVVRLDRPLKTAFDREKSNMPITTTDSVAFWTSIDSLHAYLGMGALFAPANIDELPSSARGVRIIVDTTGCRACASPNVAVDRIIGGQFEVNSVQVFANPRIIMHEAIHVFGFGHTCLWHTIMIRLGCSSFPTPYSSTTPTPIDVAYIWIMYLIRDFQIEENFPYGILEAKNGEEMVSRLR